MPSSPHCDERQFLERILRAESDAVAGLIESLGPEFHRAVDLLDHCAQRSGTVLVTGLGKSGHIGTKIAATLTSLGITAHFVHPAEAAHGDLGRFRPDDACLALSFSGETYEVVSLAAILHQDGIPVISITGGRRGGGIEPEPTTSLEHLATVVLRIGVTEEAAGSDYAAPTCSTTATLALGDALALAAAHRRNFTNADFAKRHPGGALGGLLRPVVEVLRFRVGKNLPLIPETISVREALERAEEFGRRPGALVVIDPVGGRLTGIFTDGDLRRLVRSDPAYLSRPIRDVMTRAPHVLPDSALVRDAVRMVQEFRADEVPVVDDAGRPVGILDVQDLIAMKLVRD